MDSIKILICLTTLLFMFTYAQAATLPESPPTILTPTPAPAPAPEYVNLADLLSVAGPFSTFLKYLESTKVIETLQNQANNTEEGITLFVPKDKAFSSLKKPSLSNLTADQLKQLCLFHALPHYYSLSDFKNLSGEGPINTLAGGSYTLNFTDDSGTVRIGSGWTNTVVSSSVHSTDPVAIYQVNKVLLPEAIFGTDIPTPAPAPAPVPDIAPVADSPDADGGKGSAAKASSPSSSHRISWWSVWRCLMVVVVSGGFVVVL
ncbi:hypothetical protein L1987_49425 [Smallanthus sonchifolius]|uniref:Uncharacterized protein n=1 Tax=Smallanthus sonchifolius TaxID=185202 RepID=A0ACB9FUQ0_9ASTR|nr:hypothetical protein L1987_49425 [Smallanthus sonchifolius]